MSCQKMQQAKAGEELQVCENSDQMKDSMTAIFCIAIDIFGLTFQITYLGAAYTRKFKKKT